MANHKSALKRIRRNGHRAEINKARRSRVRTFVKNVEEAIGAGNQEAAREALRQAEPEMARAAGKGVMHRNTMSRKVSRLSARIKGMTAAG